jgi:hypothetical protein
VSQSRNVRASGWSEQEKGNAPFVAASRVFIYVSINASLRAEQGATRYGTKRNEIAV